MIKSLLSNKTEVNESTDELPIGIILCANKNDIVAEYAIGGMENQIFVSKYKYYLPSKKNRATNRKNITRK